MEADRGEHPNIRRHQWRMNSHTTTMRQLKNDLRESSAIVTRLCVVVSSCLTFRVLAGPLWSVYEGERQGRLVMDIETQKRDIVRYTTTPRFSSGHTMHFNVIPRQFRCHRLNHTCNPMQALIHSSMP